MARHYSTTQLRILLIEPSGVQASVITSLQKLGASHIDHVINAGQWVCCRKTVRAGAFRHVSGRHDRRRAADAHAQPAETQNLAFILVSSETRPQMLEPVRQLGVCAVSPNRSRRSCCSAR